MSLSKNLVEFAPAGANKMSICFVRWRVHRTKHITGCKCGICAQAAHKLCAPHRAACSNANPAPRFAFESLSKRLFDKLRRRRKASPFSLPMDAGYAPSCCRSGRHGGKCAPPIGSRRQMRAVFWGLMPILAQVIVDIKKVGKKAKKELTNGGADGNIAERSCEGSTSDARPERKTSKNLEKSS